MKMNREAWQLKEDKAYLCVVENYPAEEEMPCWRAGMVTASLQDEMGWDFLHRGFRPSLRGTDSLR